MNLKGNYINSTAIKIEWGLVPEEDRNGIIRRYIINYRSKGDLSEWQEITVDHPVLTLQIGTLQYYTVYEFKLAAETTVGRGPFSNVTNIRTDADGKRIYFDVPCSVLRRTYIWFVSKLCPFLQWGVVVSHPSRQSSVGK